MEICKQTDLILLDLAISSTTEGQVLQTDIACLEQWVKMWDVQFYPFIFMLVLVYM